MGELFVTGFVDYEAVHSYTLVVTVTDYRSYFVKRTFTLYVLDVNDNVPTFSSPIYYLTVPENTSPNTALVVTLATGHVTNISATDADSGLNAMLIFLLSNPASQIPFTIDLVGLSMVVIKLGLFFYFLLCYYLKMNGVFF